MEPQLVERQRRDRLPIADVVFDQPKQPVALRLRRRNAVLGRPAGARDIG
jgi:hypothetical protein